VKESLRNDGLFLADSEKRGGRTQEKEFKLPVKVEKKCSCQGEKDTEISGLWQYPDKNEAFGRRLGKFRSGSEGLKFHPRAPRTRQKNLQFQGKPFRGGLAIAIILEAWAMKKRGGAGEKRKVKSKRERATNKRSIVREKKNHCGAIRRELSYSVSA